MQTNANEPETLEVPELPSDLSPPAAVSSWDGEHFKEYAVVSSDGTQWLQGDGVSEPDATFVAALINAVYLPNGLRDQLAKLTAERDAAVALLRRSTPFLGGWVGYQEVRDDIESFLQQFDGNGNGGDHGTLTAGGVVSK